MEDLSVLELAYVGDAIYELLVRKYLLSCSFCFLKKLKEESLKFVTAKRQAYFLDKMQNFLTPFEADLVRRGRNAKTNSKPKHCSVITYRYATAFEVLFGYHYMKGNELRIQELFNEVIRIEKEEKLC